MGSFVPLVFSTFNGMSGCTNVVYKRLAYLLSLKRGVPYSSVMAWLRCRLSFRCCVQQLLVSGEHVPTVAAQPAIGLLTLL